jgi:hypothetical protein
MVIRPTHPGMLLRDDHVFVMRNHTNAEAAGTAFVVFDLSLEAGVSRRTKCAITSLPVATYLLRGNYRLVRMIVELN